MEGVEEEIDIAPRLVLAGVESPQQHLVLAAAVAECWLPGWRADWVLDSEMGLSRVPSQEARVELGVVSAPVAAATGIEGASVACIEPEVPWRTLLGGLKACRKWLTSMIDREAWSACNSNGPSPKRGDYTHIPCLRPVGEIVMIYPPLQRYMLANADRHVLCRGHVDDWRLPRVCIWDPKRDRESVCCAPEVDRECAHQVEEER